MIKWLNGFTTATLLAYGVAMTFVGYKIYEENLELKSKLESKKEEEE